MYADPRQAYENSTRTSDSSRELEANALFKAARLLEASVQNWNGEESRARLDAALRFNQKLWTFFQAELTDASNPLPRELRSSLLSLSLFVDKRTFEIMSDAQPDRVRILIDINRHIASGLSTPVAENATTPS